MNILSLPEETRVELMHGLATITVPHQDLHVASSYLYKAFSCLPNAALQQILQFGRSPSEPGVMLVEGLPLDAELPDTPTNREAQNGPVAAVAEKTLLGLAQLIGTPVGYLSEKEGNLVHHVVPMPGGEYTQSNRGSRVFLNYHNDSMYDQSGIFNSHNPDFLLLLCLRPDKQGEAKTMYADARQICATLTSEQNRILRQPRFKMAAPSNYTLLIQQADPSQKIWSRPVPIVTGPVRTPEIYLAANGVLPLDDEAEQTLQALHAVCHEVGDQHATHLQPGQALLINNRKGVHARTEFTANYDGKDRWLLRANIRTGLWHIRDRATEEALVFA
ncbi:TauD/TfdA family dioxygenase [Paraburkholderia caribensis]|uniref:TauD/TfdA family dioxygenase n=1 Tax=Paraburkholderia caribensis TaxID=75105 RepID=UPI0007C77577|nr:TauD/TfdA family dioxygenase [Paraburkholderia caribensis]